MKITKSYLKQIIKEEISIYTEAVEDKNVNEVYEIVKKKFIIPILQGNNQKKFEFEPHIGAYRFWAGFDPENVKGQYDGLRVTYPKKWQQQQFSQLLELIKQGIDTIAKQLMKSEKLYAKRVAIKKAAEDLIEYT